MNIIRNLTSAFIVRFTIRKIISEGIITSVMAENGGVTLITIASIADKNEGYKFIGRSQ